MIIQWNSVYNVTTSHENLAVVMLWPCTEMQVNAIHALYDKHHKVFSFLKSHQNTHHSVKYEVI